MFVTEKRNVSLIHHANVIRQWAPFRVRTPKRFSLFSVGKSHPYFFLSCEIVLSVLETHSFEQLVLALGNVNFCLRSCSRFIAVRQSLV